MTTPRTFFRNEFNNPYRQADIDEAIKALERAKTRLGPEALLATVESREYPREPSVHDKIIALIHQAQEAAWQCHVTQTTVDGKTYRRIKSTIEQAIILLGEMKP